MPKQVILKSTPWTELETVDRLSRDDAWYVSYAVQRWLMHATTREEQPEAAKRIQGSALQMFVLDELERDPLLVSPNGRLIRRLGNAIFKKFGLRRDERLAAYINDVIENLSFSGVIYARFDPLLDWEPGTYGDRGSCFMSDDHSIDRYMLTASNAYAFQVKSNNKGVGRCWVVADNKRDRVFAFNFYGVNSTKMIQLLRQLLTSIGNPELQGEWSTFSMYVKAGDINKHVYINNSEAYCMMTDELDYGRERRVLRGDTCIGVNQYMARNHSANRLYYGDKRCRFCICHNSEWSYDTGPAPEEHIQNARYFRD